MKKIISLATAFTMLLSILIFGGVYAQEEVLINDSFENGIGEGWSYANDYARSNITVDTSTAADGKKSLLFNDDSEKASAVLHSKKFDATEGDTFDISASFKQLEGSPSYVYYKFADEGGSEISKGSIGSKSTEWNTQKKTVVAPKGTNKIFIQLTGFLASTGKTYIDNVKLVRTGKGTGVSTAPSVTPAPAPSAPVAVPNGDIMFSDNFEGDMSKWIFTNDYAKTNHVIVDSEAHEGSKALCATDDSDAKSPIIKSPLIQGKAGEGFNISASFKHESGNNFKIWVKYYDANGKNQVNGESFGSSKKEWNIVEKNIFIPSGSETFQIWITGTNKTLGKTYIDNLYVTKLSTEETEKLKPVELPAPEVIEGIPAQSDKFHIYLCIGQSNMVGADSVKKEDIVKVEGAYLYNLNSKWEVAQPYPVSGNEYMGFNRYSSVAKGSGRMGPTVGFARGMVKKVPEGVKIGIISNAFGGTTIAQWSKGYEATTDRPDYELFESAVNRTKEALQKGGVLKGIFWLQGESCAYKPGYMENLVKVAADLRAELGVKAEEVPFIVSEVPQVRPDAVKVLRTAPEHIENCYVISSEGLSIFDSIHFDADSQRKLGLRFAETALSKIYGITASADDMYKEIYGNVKEEVKTDEVVYTILVNGKKLVTDVPPHEAGGRLFVPVRAIFEELGATVSWDDATQTVTGVRGDRTVVMQIGDEHMTVNGVRTAMLIAPMLKDMRTLVPIRFVGEGLGATVNWDEKTFTASIDLK